MLLSLFDGSVCLQYFGMFDCPKCLKLKQLPARIAALGEGEEHGAERLRLQLKLQSYQRHSELRFLSSISTSR